MKKGFTLIELIGVIIVLSLISLLAVPSITNTIKNSRIKLYNDQVENIEDAAKIWGSKNISELPENIGDEKDITLLNLKELGLIDEKIKDPRTKKEFSNSLIIKITKKSENSYSYKLIENT